MHSFPMCVCVEIQEIRKKIYIYMSIASYSFCLLGFICLFVANALLFFNLPPQLVKKDVLLPVKVTAIIFFLLFDTEII